MKTIEYPNEPIWYIAYNTGQSVAVLGTIDEDQVVSTGLDNLESFTTEAEAKYRSIELTGSDQAWIDAFESDEEELVS